MSRVKKRHYRLISMLMVTIMLFSHIPAQALAAGIGAEDSIDVQNNEEPSDGDIQSSDEMDTSADISSTEHESTQNPTPEVGSEAATSETEILTEAPEEASITSGINSISGFVWVDLNEDGEYKPVDGEFPGFNEEPVAGHTIELLKADDLAVVDQVETDTDGKYSFADIAPGEYTVRPKEEGGLLPPIIGLVGRNKILNEQEDAQFAGTVGKLIVDETSQIADLDIGMRKLQIRPRAGGIIDISTVTPLTAPMGTTFVSNVLTFTSAANGDTYELIGTVSGYNTRRIVVDPNVNVTIILNGISITETNKTSTITSLFEMKAGSNVTLHLAASSTNSFAVSDGITNMTFKGAISASDLTIEGDGTLNAIGAIPLQTPSCYGAGIRIADGSRLHIKSGTIVCTADTSAAIGGAVNNGKGEKPGTVIIDGGTITATSDMGAGLGGSGGATYAWGDGGDGGNVTINGGRIDATSRFGAGIGGGSPYSSANYGGAGGHVKINGGIVKAISRYGAGIGRASIFNAVSGGINEFTSGNIFSRNTSNNTTFITDQATTTNGLANGSQNVYCIRIHVQDSNGARVPGVTVKILNLDNSGYTYTATTDEIGYASCWVPVSSSGQPLKIEAEHATLGHGKAEYTMTADNNNNNRGMTLDMRTTVDLVYGGLLFKQAATDQPQLIRVKADNYTDINTSPTNQTSSIDGLEWFRVSATDSTVYTESNFSSGFGMAGAADKGIDGGAMQKQSSSTDLSHQYHMYVGINGKYWVKVYYKDAKGNSRNQVREVVVNNIYTQARGTYKGVKATDANHIFYNDPIPDSVIKYKVGIAYDLDNTTALFSTVDGTTPISAVGGISGSFTLSAKTIPGGLWIANPASKTVTLTGYNLGETVFQYSPNPSALVIDFDPQGGTPASIADAYYMHNDVYGTLPILTRTGYNFLGWSKSKVGTTVFSSARVTASHTLYAQWSKTTSTIHVRYVDRNGSPVAPSPSPSIEVLLGTSFVASAITIPNMMYVGWYSGSGAPSSTINATTVTPHISSVNGGHDGTTITLVYGMDHNGDGTEDVKLNIAHTTTTGTTEIGTPDFSIVDVGATFNRVADTITGHTDAGQYLDTAGTVQVGSPSFVATPAHEGKTVTYHYEVDSYAVNVTYQFRDSQGNVTSLPGSQNETLTYGSTFDSTSTPALTIPTFSQGTVVGWTLNGTAQTAPIPGISSVTGITNIVLVYGQVTSGGGGGITTPVKTYTITEKHMSGAKVINTYSRTVNEGNTYNGAIDSNLPKGYTYMGYQVDNNATTGTAPNLPVLTNVLADHTVVLEYRAAQCGINVKYEYHANNGKVTTLTGSQNATVAGGSAFTPTIPKFKQKVQTEWTLNGKEQTGKPTVKSVTGATNIVLIYRQDMDEDGVHDYNIKEVSTSNASGKVLQTRTVYIAKGKSYTVAPKQINHYMYLGYLVDGGKLQKAANNIFTVFAAVPAIQTVNADHTVDMLYVPKVYQITVKVVNENGKAISGEGYTVEREYQQQFIASAPQVNGHEFVEWLLDGKKQKGNTVKIASVEKDAVATAVFQKTEIADTKKENYEFIKKPNVKNVAAGQIVTYTFSGFGNKWGVPLERYSIIDNPDKGLDFVSAKLPAFTNGSGVTYSVYYFTKNGGATQKTIATGISAVKPYRFSAPQIGSNDYITMISIEFGKVPTGFAVGNTLQMSFKVWDNPPAGTLSNIGILAYKIGDKHKEFVTDINGGATTIQGWISPPKTGDSSGLALTYTIMGVSLGGIVILSGDKKRKKRKIE